MSRAVSIHIGVNQPQTRYPGHPLQHSEASAWRMAQLASQAGYHSLRVLRGSEATRHAVDEALADAAQTLKEGDILFLSFSGHGSRERDMDEDDGHGWDESWCLHDDILLDDKLAGFWRLFEPGVRILVVAESCFSGGCGRTGRRGAAHSLRATRRSTGQSPEPAGEATPCIREPPHDAGGIRASLLLVAASGEDQPSQDGVFTDHLLALWDDGAFRGSYCELYTKLRARLMSASSQEPQIVMLGAPDLAFPMETAFHRDGPARP